MANTFVTPDWILKESKRVGSVIRRQYPLLFDAWGKPVVTLRVGKTIHVRRPKSFSTVSESHHG